MLCTIYQLCVTNHISYILSGSSLQGPKGLCQKFRSSYLGPKDHVKTQGAYPPCSDVQDREIPEAIVCRIFLSYIPCTIYHIPPTTYHVLYMPYTTYHILHTIYQMSMWSEALGILWVAFEAALALGRLLVRGRELGRRARRRHLRRPPLGSGEDAGRSEGAEIKIRDSEILFRSERF